LKNKCLTLFPESILKEREEFIIKVILHECAHFILNQKSPIINNLSNKEMMQEENDADKLVKRWLKTEK
jgi:predicted SprT family Zn-dependent metalloprotease